jgi:Alpha-L-arabinofuranosidase B, catalytic
VPIGGSLVGYRAAVLVYSGPGDIVSGATAWWGLRAYSSAAIGGNAVRFRRDSDNAEQDFATIAGGGVDLAAIATFKGAANLFFAKLYDQTGNGRDLTQATAGTQPRFTSSAPVTSLPAIDGASAAGYMETAAITLPQPFTYSTVARAPSGFQVLGYNAGSGLEQIRHNAGAANQWDLVGTVSAIAVGGTTDNVWHTAQGIFDDPSSDFVIDGTSNTGAIGTGGFSAAAFGLLAAGAGTVPWAGYCAEFGIWPIAFSAGQKTGMDANQAAYWGV